MSRAKGIINKNIAKIGQLSGKALIIFLFFTPETGVLKQQHIAWFKSFASAPQ